MNDENFKILLARIDKIDDRLHEYNTIVNNDNKHMFADISAIKVQIQGIQNKIDKLCGKDDTFDVVLSSNNSKTVETAAKLKLLLQILLPALTLIVGMWVQGKL